MTKNLKGKAAIAGAIGSAAIAAAMLYVSKRRDKTTQAKGAPKLPSGEKPETD